MPDVTQPLPLGSPVWVDLTSSDPVASRAFYTALFGWTAQTAEDDFGGYVTFSLDGLAVAALVGEAASGEQADRWTTYFAVLDAHAGAAAVAAAGGTVAMPAMAVGRLGSLAIVADPVGATFGLWQAGEFGGFGRLDEPGSVAWTELRTTGYPAAATFYTALLGWRLSAMSDSDEFRYSTAHLGTGGPIAGLMDVGRRPAARSAWDTYFRVSDADDAVARAVALGARVREEPHDSPFGRIAWLSDVTGAPLVLLGPAPTSP